MLISFDQALVVVQDFVATLAPVEGTQTIELAKAADRVLAEPAVADRDQPPFDRSTRDGFAVRAADLTEEGVAELLCVGELAAGGTFAGTVERGQCIEIMTGAPMPTGADAVVMVENCERLDHARVRLRARPTPGENVVPRGAEAKQGAVVLPAGRRLDPAAIGLLASVGHVQPAARRRPWVAVVTTGDEIVAAEETPAPAQIRNSNEHLLSAAVERSGAQAQRVGPVSDTPAAIRQALQSALAADMVVMTGGVSKGKHDHVLDVLRSLGADILFAGVAMRPGKPVVLARLTRGAISVPVLALPGNPLSAMVGFGLFGRPVLARLAGMSAWSSRFVQAPLARSYDAPPIAFAAVLPATWEGGPMGAAVRPLSSQGSGDLVVMANADVLMCLPPNTGRLPAGSLVRVLDKP